MASTNFINECKNRANGNRMGKIIIDGVTNPITNSDNLQSFTIDGGCYIDGNIIGSVYAKCLNGNFIAVSTDTDLIDKQIQAQVGVKYADNTTEYIGLGKYIIERPTNEQTANMQQITAYDILYDKLDSPYVCGIDYEETDDDGKIITRTLADLYEDVCSASNLNLTRNESAFLNSTIPITANPFTNGEKNRTVLQTIAKIACSWIEIDNDTNKIKLCWLSQSETPDYTFYRNDYSTLTGGDIQYGPVNNVVIKNSQVDDENVSMSDEESIEEYGEHSIIISEDYILYNSDLRQQAITAIFNRVNGLKYIDASIITYYGKPFLAIGSKIRIYKDDTNYIDSYVLNHKFTYDGTFYSQIDGTTLTEQEIKTKQDISLADALANTQLTIDKQNQQISSVVSTTVTMQQQIDNNAAIANNNYQDTLEKIDNCATSESVVQVTQAVETLQTSTQASINVINETLENGVPVVKTNKGFTFSDDGLDIDETNSPTKSNLDTDGLTIIDKTGGTNEELFFSGYDNVLMQSIVRTANLLVRTYLMLGNNHVGGDWRVEIFNDDTYGLGVGFFYMGDD